MIFLIFHLFFAIFIFFLTLAFLTGAPFVPSNKKTAKKMVEFAEINEESVVYDLGSGDGRLLILSSEYKPKKVIGLEINPWLVFYTKLRIIISGKKNIHVYWKNFWNTQLTDANIVFVYLLPWKMEALARKLEKELKPGSIVVSNSFIFPSWQIIHKDEVNHVYVFKI